MQANLNDASKWDRIIFSCPVIGIRNHHVKEVNHKYPNAANPRANVVIVMMPVMILF